MNDELFQDDAAEEFTLYRAYPVKTIEGVVIGELLGVDYEVGEAFETAKRLVEAEQRGLVGSELVATEWGYELITKGATFVKYEISETPKMGVDFL